MNKNICLILTLLIFAINLNAQNKQTTKIKPFKDGEIVVKKTGSISSVQMKPSFIESSNNGKYNLFFFAHFIRINKYPTNVPLITVAFYSNSKDCKFPDDLNAKSEIVIDNKIVALTNNIEDKDKLLKDGGGFANYNELEGDICNGMYMMQLSKKTFLNFYNAKKVEVKIGEYKFELKPNNLQSLRNIAKLLIPKKK